MEGGGEFSGGEAAVASSTGGGAEGAESTSTDYGGSEAGVSGVSEGYDMQPVETTAEWNTTPAGDESGLEAAQSADAAEQQAAWETAEQDAAAWEAAEQQAAAQETVAQEAAAEQTAVDDAAAREAAEREAAAQEAAEQQAAEQQAAQEMAAEQRNAAEVATPEPVSANEGQEQPADDAVTERTGENGPATPDGRQGELLIDMPERDFSNMRFERPSPHDAIEQLQMEQYGRHIHELQSSMATADSFADVVKVTQEGLAERPGTDDEVDLYLLRQHGKAPYTDDVG